MAEKKKKTVIKYKATDPKRFASMCNDSVPKYKELCEGKSVQLDENNKHLVSWLKNKILIKEK